MPKRFESHYVLKGGIPVGSGKPLYKHPELQEGEVFLGNFIYGNFLKISYKTKRLGRMTYDRHGKPLTESSVYPVFAQRDELKAEGIDPDNLTW